MVITKKQVFKTVLLPGLLPRIGQLFGTGFGTLAYLIAVVYNTVRILPNNHPYLRAEMIGKYSIRQVIAEASNHIKPDKKNIDQIIIFFSVIAALIILLIQFVLLIAAMVITQAQAAVSMPTKVEDFFKTPNPKEDIAYRLLDLVFGIPDFFGSKEKVDTSLHQALHSLFEFYSYGIIIVGALIIVYFVVAIVAETAQSGTPFGQRFNKTWAPIRVILFFGLLIPISNGLNGGQYITLASAKWGSALASTGWTLFNDSINSTPLGDDEKAKLVAKPNYSDLSYLPAFMLVAKTCEVGYKTIYNKESKAFPDSWAPGGGETGVQAWAVYQIREDPGAAGARTGNWKWQSEKMESTTFQNISEKSSGTDFSIVFGVKDPKIYTDENGSVAPICGEIILKVTDVSQPGSAVIHTAYYDLIKSMWQGTREINTYAENYIKRGLTIKNFTDPKATLPTEEYIKSWIAFLKDHMEKDKDGVIAKAIEAQINQGKWQMPDEVKDYGWAGAGVWYNKIAEQNGALASALRLTPATALYPRVMELTKQLGAGENTEPDFKDVFKPSFSAGASDPMYRFPGEDEVAATLNVVYLFWQTSELKAGIKKTDNIVIDTINMLLGSGSLFEICKNTDVHPLAQLSMVGKSMVDSSIRAIGISGLLGFASIFAGTFQNAVTAASGFFSTVATIGLLAGFILFYVLPFMPFLYFFFAVGGWVKSIFEAMVAMPLWALAHLRIDGEGIPGDAAIGGYFLIFEIFIRPILIVVGLLAAISIFAGMVKVLNEIFYLVLANLSGHESAASSTDCFKPPASGDNSKLGAATEDDVKDAARGAVDEFFFTILYTIVVYMIGTASFKLIDMIPNNILRWINAEVPSFNDNAGDAAEGFMTYITLGGSQFGEQIGGSIKQMGGGAAETVRQFLGK
ncbi:MAG TPA: DotA/TraY family protein [Alphaproteobacteria bacterium]|nr:DotA/TraY family protein [Alphaproteobacteria bacterium]